MYVGWRMFDFRKSEFVKDFFNLLRSFGLVVMLNDFLVKGIVIENNNLKKIVVKGKEIFVRIIKKELLKDMVILRLVFFGLKEEIVNKIER